LMLADHLNWNNEKEHLILLQDKINAYLGFIESGQYADNYPNINFEYFIIDIRCKYGVTSNCLKFFKAVNNQLKEDNIHLCHKED
jgi:hypothetical protein